MSGVQGSVHTLLRRLLPILNTSAVSWLRTNACGGARTSPGAHVITDHHNCAMKPFCHWKSHQYPVNTAPVMADEMDIPPTCNPSAVRRTACDSLDCKMANPPRTQHK